LREGRYKNFYLNLEKTPKELRSFVVNRQEGEKKRGGPGGGNKDNCLQFYGKNMGGKKRG
jgi:hypothetical protein